MKELLFKIIKNKFLIATLIFLLWIIFFDENNVRSILRFQKKNREMKTEIEYYKEKIKKDSMRIIELKSSKENLEKFAREQYYMKSPNEDIFIIIPPDENE